VCPRAIEEEMIATQEDAVSADVLGTHVTDRIAVITLGSPKRVDERKVNRG
jgi:hypothetical protein